MTKRRTNSRAIAVVCLLMASPTASACSSGIPSSTSSRLARSSVGEGTSQVPSPIGRRAPIRSRLRDELAVEGRSEGLLELLLGDRLGLLGAERLQEQPLELEGLLGSAGCAELEQPLDRLQVEALALHVLDQADPVDVLLAVVAGARPHGRGREQSAGLVGADVPGGHPGLVGQLVDRQLDRSRSLAMAWSLCRLRHRPVLHRGQLARKDRTHWDCRRPSGGGEDASSPSQSAGGQAWAAASWNSGWAMRLRLSSRRTRSLGALARPRDPMGGPHAAVHPELPALTRGGGKVVGGEPDDRVRTLVGAAQDRLGDPVEGREGSRRRPACRPSPGASRGR